MEVILEKITKKDLEFARKLRNKNRKYFLDQRYIVRAVHVQWFKKLNYPFYIIWVNKERVGTIGLKPYNNKSNEITNVLIDEKYRHQGILAEVLRKFKHVDYLEVRVDNEQAIEAYKKLG